MNEITIDVSNKTEEEIDILIAELIEQGFRPQIIDPEKDKEFLIENVNKGEGYADYISDELLNPVDYRVYLRFYSDDEKLKRFNSEGLSIEQRDVSNWDFENEWKKHFKPLEIGNIAVVPFWEEYEHNQKFIINPGHLFGTGFHESTNQCIKAMQNLELSEKAVLDIGCGTGILGLIALMVGADNATFIDIEPAAKQTVTNNAELNKLEGVKEILVGDILTEPNLVEKIQKYDIIFLNIVADVIIKMLPIVKTFMKENAKLICAGIIIERREDVLEALSTEGFKVINIENLNDWIGIVSTNETFHK
ncbi:MAG: 50S ribosomal protein L11 methyltransferase [Defluviitaleaceae bacterium]|nr:50S ribosomal protein L11 methyltransferase [Defluviitaleaceae bacterium]